MIDSKDFVVRMNSCRIVGFEHKVGKRQVCILKR